MDPRHLYVDQRLVGACSYCGDAPGTSDHVPSKIFLDDPLPPNLPVVYACEPCNRSFSLDEEYVGCLLECVLCGTVDPDGLRREKVKQTLVRKPFLAEKIRASRRILENGNTAWETDAERICNVVLKLARGHAAYELSLPQLDDPFHVSFKPFVYMSDAERDEFERAGSSELLLWPEFGSRAFLRACGSHPYGHQVGPWILVQEDRYRYSVDQPAGVLVQIVFSEYLGCVVAWE